MNIQELDLTKPELVLEVMVDTEYKALFVGKDHQEVKTQIKIVHSQPHLTSRVNIKAVVYDYASFDLEALLVIDKGASNTDTYLKISALIMDETARARAVPSLEIKEDNVKGGHGATVGMVDSNQIYYLMSRGLNRSQAEAVIVEAFINS